MKKHLKFHLSSLAVTFVAITAVASILASVGSFVTAYNRDTMREITANTEQSVDQTCLMVSSYLDSLKSILKQLSAEILSADSTDSVKEKLNISAALHTDIQAASIYAADGSLILYGSDKTNLKEDLSNNTDFNRKLFENSTAREYIVSVPHVQTMFEEYYPWVVTMAHREYQPLFEKYVYVAIDLSFIGIARYIDNIGIGQHGYSYIIDDSGDIVYHPRQQMIYSGLKTEEINELSNYKDGTYTKSDRAYAIKSLQGSNWRIVGVGFTSDLAKSRSKAIARVVTLSLTCCIIMTVFIMFIFSRWFSRPIFRLVSEMKKFETDPDNYRYKSENNLISEMQTITDSYEQMVKMTKELMEQVREEEMTLRKTELKALQAQINPHFLYNTLDSIQWMCEQKKTDDAIKMVGALARLFRISISRGKELIPIKDEIQHARSYLIIQSYRYKDQFTYEFNVEPELEDCLCNKITIQPLIENAIYHGIDRMVDEGKITVNVQSDSDDILITVSDNGVGMTEEQCRSILSKERTDSGGIGIKNVNDRLRIYFGNSYGITINSELDVGTTVIVRIPKLREEPNNVL